MFLRYHRKNVWKKLFSCFVFYLNFILMIRKTHNKLENVQGFPFSLHWQLKISSCINLTIICNIAKQYNIKFQLSGKQKMENFVWQFCCCCVLSFGFSWHFLSFIFIRAWKREFEQTTGWKFNLLNKIGCN